LLLDVLRNENLMLNWFEEGLGRLNNAAAFVQDRGIDYVQTKTDNPHALFAINTIELSDIADFYTQRPNGIDLSALDGHSRKECWKLLNGKHTEEQEDRLRAATETLGPYLKKYTR
jgi:hypothetical protein